MGIMGLKISSIRILSIMGCFHAKLPAKLSSLTLGPQIDSGLPHVAAHPAEVLSVLQRRQGDSPLH